MLLGLRLPKNDGLEVLKDYRRSSNYVTNPAKYRILFVDDEEGIRFTLGSLLRKEGVSCRCRRRSGQRQRLASDREL